MLTQKMTNTPLLMAEIQAENERPADGECVQCHGKTEPVLVHRPKLLGNSRWFGPFSVCRRCELKAEAEAAHAEKMQQQREKLAIAFKHAKVSPRFRERTFSSFQITQGNQNAHKAALNFNPRGSEGLLLMGPCGTGKTHLAAAIVNRCVMQIPALFISCPDLLLSLRQSINTKKDTTALNAAMGVQLLVIDDIGAEKPSDWVRETLFVLINHRYEYKLPTILTTNCTMPEIDQQLGIRIASRLVEMCRLIRVEGEDFRLKIRKGIL